MKFNCFEIFIYKIQKPHVYLHIMLEVTTHLLYKGHTILLMFSHFFFTLADWPIKIKLILILFWYLFCINIEDLGFEGLYLFRFVFVGCLARFINPFRKSGKIAEIHNWCLTTAIYNIVKVLKIVNFLLLINALYKLMVKVVSWYEHVTCFEIFQRDFSHVTFLWIYSVDFFCI